jgi:hypothetical protein
VRPYHRLNRAIPETSPRQIRSVGVEGYSPRAIPQAGHRREQLASDPLRRKPRRRSQTHRSHERKNDWQDKEVSPAHNRDGSKAQSERPHGEPHVRQSRCPKATQLPRQCRREEIKYANRESGRDKQIPIRPAEPLHVKVKRPHGTKKRINSPCGVGLAKTNCMSHSKKHQKNRSNSIKNRRLHVLPPQSSAILGGWPVRQNDVDIEGRRENTPWYVSGEQTRRRVPHPRVGRVGPSVGLCLEDVRAASTREALVLFAPRDSIVCTSHPNDTMDFSLDDQQN